MDIDQEEKQARREFLETQERATYGGDRVSDEQLRGAADGWDAAIAFLKKSAFRRLLGA